MILSSSLPSPKPLFFLHKPHSHSHLHSVSLPNPNPNPNSDLSPGSAAALAAALRRASPASPVKFRTERIGNVDKTGPPLPSSDFQRLCVEQLELFRMVVRSDAVLSVYVRPAGSYMMNQLELRRVAIFPAIDKDEKSDYVILIGNFSVVAGLKLAEAELSKQEMDFVPEFGAIVIPLLKHPFIVGFLVAELPNLEREIQMEMELDYDKVKIKSDGLNLNSDEKNWGIQAFKEDLVKSWGINFSNEQKSRAVMICRSLATAYVMDQKALLLQQTSWQNNVRMSQLVEQIRGPLSSIKALAKMLSMYVKRNEVPYDIIEDIIIQGDQMKDALQQIQDAVYLTKANIVRMNGHTNGSSNYSTPFLPDFSSKNPDSNSGFELDSKSGFKPESNSLLSVPSEKKDSELPMPPLWLVPLQQNNTRPCDVSDLLEDLVSAATPLARAHRRSIELSRQAETAPLLVAVEESALRQALSNLIEGALLRSREGGGVRVYVGGAPAGGALVVVDDDGPDMQYMTQMHALTPFGSDLLGNGAGMAEDNMAWNFVAGLAVACEVLEAFGCVVRVVSPRKPDAPSFGHGGTRVELWLPALISDNFTGEGSEDVRSA